MDSGPAPRGASRNDGRCLWAKRRAVRREASIILQQALDVVELELRAGGVAEAAAQLFEDAADPLHVDLAGDFHGEVVPEVAAAQWSAQWIGIAAPALLAAGAVARAVVLAIAVAGLHLLREVPRALPHGFQRL